MLTEVELADPARVLAELTALLENPEMLRTMGEHARTLAHPHAVAEITRLIAGLAKTSHRPSHRAGL
jgi:UDP-N-acetylglucosamine:LPS N-acetylglucosamine transferase